MTLKDALNEPDAEKFVEAMIKEVNDQLTRKHWIIVSVHDMIKNGYKEKPIMGVWSMKRNKMNPLGLIVKYKARWCAHGGQTILQYVRYNNVQRTYVHAKLREKYSKEMGGEIVQLIM